MPQTPAFFLNTLALLGLTLPSVAAAAPATANSAATLETWHGTVSLGERRISVGLTLYGTGAELWLPDQGIRGIPMTVQGGAANRLSVRLEHWPGQPQVAVQRTGTGDAQLLSGTFQQGGFKSPITLWHGPIPSLPRPQEPRSPLPYRTREVTILGAGGTPLSGTLTLPSGAGPFAAAVLVSGSGPQDRDSTLHGHRPFLVLADALTRRGMAVLRLDDRGVGGSGSDLYTAHYSDLSDDISAAVTFLRGHPSVRPQQVGLIGHSEGGSLVMLTAQELRPAPAFAVLLGSPAVPGRELLSQQLRAQLAARGLNKSTIEAQVTAQAQALSGQRPDPNRLPLSGSELEQAWLHARPFARSTYLKDFLAYDPRPALEASRVPTLAVFGSLDLQVPPSAGAQPMRALLSRSSSAANIPSEVHELPRLNHLLQPARSGLPEEYAEIPTTLDLSALNLLTRWLERGHWLTKG